MFALLRSSACSIRQATTTTTSIQLRLATRSDVPAIQRTNLACLPENYNSQFYCSHLRQWPDLALVAEEVQHPTTPNGEQQRSSDDRSLSRNTFSGFAGGPPSDNNNNNNHEPKIVAYVLGKVETRPSIDYNDPTSSSRRRRVERLGHVTSLAVQKDFRRLGLAKAMMTQLHYHLQHHGIDSCGLHVRTSNMAACRLYRDDGYEVDQIIKSYYQDGEDAYFMRRVFHEEDSLLSNNNYNYGGAGRIVKKAWKSGPEELRLPRIHHPNLREVVHESERPSSNSGHTPPSAELLSGI
jgi:ribosomal protein S18 acetylase RimI-like enzyme